MPTLFSKYASTPSAGKLWYMPFYIFWRIAATENSYFKYYVVSGKSSWWKRQCARVYWQAKWSVVFRRTLAVVETFSVMIVVSKLNITPAGNLRVWMLIGCWNDEVRGVSRKERKNWVMSIHRAEHLHKQPKWHTWRICGSQCKFGCCLGKFVDHFFTEKYHNMCFFTRNE